MTDRQSESDVCWRVKCNDPASVPVRGKKDPLVVTVCEDCAVSLTSTGIWETVEEANA